jgi:eukaryotic-like serine/threonine-protein kinase
MKICPTCESEYGGGEVFCPVDGARLTTPSMLPPSPDGDDPLVGAMLSDRYRIVRPIGEGGMGIVYEAEHVLIEKRVALKVLRSDFSQKEDVVERFRQEAKSASRIGHPHIVDISDFGETPSGQSYFVMEYLDGEDLANLLEREGTVSPRRAVNIVLQCCQALGAAHRKGIVHRDMKPENVFLVRREGVQDFVKLVDFGIAKISDIETAGAPGRKLTKTGMIFGTPEYMSPEQAAGKALDHRVDIYALGIILFEMITGRVPFLGDTFMGVLTQHMFEEVPPMQEVNPAARVNPELEGAIRMALAKDPAARFQTTDELAHALEIALDFSQGPGTHPGFGDPAGRGSEALRDTPALPLVGHAREAAATRPRRPSKAVTVAASAGGLLVIGLATLWLALRPERGTADTEADAAAVVAPAEGAEGVALPEGVDMPDAVEPEATTAGAATVPNDAAADAVEEGAASAAPAAAPIAADTTPAGAPATAERKRAPRERAPVKAPSSSQPPPAKTPSPAPSDPATAPPPRAPDKSPPPPGDLKVPDIFR